MKESLTDMYDDLMPHLMRFVPSTIITLNVYEFVLRLIEHDKRL